MQIRPETPQEYNQVEAIHQLAFGGPREAQVVANSRCSPLFVAQWSLVAVVDSQLAGHILFGRVALQDPQGTLRQAVILAPLAIHPHFQNRGLGAALVQAGLEQLEAAGEAVCMVRGHAHYYPRFGFVPSVQLEIFPPFAITPAEYMARPLAAYTPDYRGSVRYPAAFAAVGYPTEFAG